MISYDSRDWFRALALHRSDTFRKLLPLMALVGLLTWGIGYIEMEHLRLSKADYVSNLPIGKAASTLDRIMRLAREAPAMP